MSPEVLTLLMFVGIFVGVFMGFPIAFTLMGMAFIFGYIGWGPSVIMMLGPKTFYVLSNYTYVAIPLFVFMGTMLDTSGIAEKAFDALAYWLRKIKGGLGVATIALCTLFAACVGTTGAACTTMGLLSLRPMQKVGYSNSLSTGIVGGASSLGILIPPSIMLVLLGPMANLSIVKLFAGAIVPGLMLSGLYIAYVLIFPRFRKDMIKDIGDVNDESIYKKVTVREGLVTFVPFLFLILCVMGAILFGVTSPTEAAGAGAFGATLLALAYKKLNWTVLKNAAFSTLKTTAMCMFVCMGANLFTGVFFAIGGNKVVSNLIQSIGLGPYGTLFVVLFIVFILGMLIDWIGIVLIVIPVFLPLLNDFGMDPLWVVLVMCVMLQSSFITPPFAYNIFYLKGIAPEGVTVGDIYRGVIPFVIMVLIGVALVILFPNIILWLPNLVS